VRLWIQVLSGVCNLPLKKKMIFHHLLQIILPRNKEKA
jgi:hypothetical protein